ncbi:hypothetical protein LCGC14_0848410 [marine sediment metagenome]|uniref:Ribbon-helix-helix protein CopG domain-containing protein n=1 Tax=marine sediment metagenome TaxID=412755 RepID=A0A0F9RVT4_9ZZZZ
MTTFEFDGPAVSLLERLRKRHGLSTRAEVLRRAITLLYVCVEAQQDGAKVYVKKNGEYKQLVVGNECSHCGAV